MDAKDDNDLILVMHDLLAAVEKARCYNSEDAFDVLAELLELAAEERGAFMQENADGQV